MMLSKSFCILFLVTLLATPSAAYIIFPGRLWENRGTRPISGCGGFQTIPTVLTESPSSSDKLRQDAEEMLAKARALRDELPDDETSKEKSKLTNPSISSPWSVLSEEGEGVGYRLYIDIGREEGTWMDARWGASGKRIEFTLDIKLRTDKLAEKKAEDRMVKDNFGGKSSQIYSLDSAPKARLRQGFDEMKCRDGAYRIDMAKNGVGTIRFYVQVEGTSQTSSYGDVSVPEGGLYFSLPAFGGKVSQLSAKEGPVTVRQTGWHTGWRREESRIVGVFRAVPIVDAKRRDGF